MLSVIVIFFVIAPTYMSEEDIGEGCEIMFVRVREHEAGLGTVELT